MNSGQPRAAIITGASSGIGAAVARRLATRGCRLGLVGRNADRLDAVAVDCAARNGGAVLSHCGDIRESAGFARFVAEFGAIDWYVSNAGILDGRREGTPIETGEQARAVLDINLVAAVDCLHHVLGPMRRQGHGRIVLVTSLAGLSPLADAPAYSASKAGLISYGCALDEALRGTGVGVTVVCPGYVDTAMKREHIGHRPHEIDADDAARRIIRAAARGRRLCGFPFPLYPAAHLSMLIPAWLNRRFTRGLRFTVAKARDQA